MWSITSFLASAVLGMRNRHSGLLASASTGKAASVLYPQVLARTYPVGLTEMTGSPGASALQPLLPFLSRLTRQRKWVILVSPPFRPSMPELIQAGIDPARFMVVQARSREGKIWAVQQALRNCPGGAVLYWPSAFPDSGLRQRIEAAALEGESSCISFCLSSNSLAQMKKAA
ncbi:MAG: hypothetical protein KGI47_02570 [Betaproteobacteria bacterium]|nr:hypothetical protein [Betaproteobacteria bacterium]MDE2622226.1 hypothetical protein [Betaproteobacteria bacterium]